MSTSNHAAITRYLERIGDGDGEAFDELLPIVYAELRRIARGQRYRSGRGVDLQTTELVHEAYLKLLGQDEPQWHNRAHFFAVAATAMRHLLVDVARHQSAAKRGGGEAPVTLDDEQGAIEREAIDVLALHEALEQLEAGNPRLARVVEYRFFGGLAEAEIGAVLGVTERTVRRDWVKARAFLHHHLDQSATDG